MGPSEEGGSQLNPLSPPSDTSLPPRSPSPPPFVVHQVEVLAYLDGDFHSMVCDISAPIEAGIPRVEQLSIDGSPTEGSPLTMSGIYSGGVEGPSEVKWFRVTETEEVCPCPRPPPLSAPPPPLTPSHTHSPTSPITPRATPGHPRPSPPPTSPSYRALLERRRGAPRTLLLQLYPKARTQPQ